MAKERIILEENELDKVVGGLLTFNGTGTRLRYTHGDGTCTYYDVANFSDAWKMSNDLHTAFVPEDDIIAQMIEKGYIK